MAVADENVRINLERARVLIVDDNPFSLSILASALHGFGVQTIHRCGSAGEAKRLARNQALDLVIVDCNMPETDGFDFVDWLRHSNLEPNAYTAVVMVTGHTQRAKVHKARDCGANFIVAKPITPRVLLDRILWVARDPRPFVEVGRYLGPDRRHKQQPPPAGVDDRRGRTRQAA